MMSVGLSAYAPWQSFKYCTLSLPQKSQQGSHPSDSMREMCCLGFKIRKVHGSRRHRYPRAPGQKDQRKGGPSACEPTVAYA